MKNPAVLVSPDEYLNTSYKVMDPENCRAWRFAQGSLEIIASPAIDLTLPSGLKLNFPAAQLFAEIDED